MSFFLSRRVPFLMMIINAASCGLLLNTEAAAETIFENICSFLPGAPFSVFFICVHRTAANFPGRFVCSPNRYKFPGGLGLFTEQIPFFQEPSLFTEQIPIFWQHLFSYRTDTDFPGAVLCVHRTDADFPGAPFYVFTEQILILLLS